VARGRSARAGARDRPRPRSDSVYTATIGTGVPHFHLHPVARYPDTPRDVPWHSVDAWEGAARGGRDEIAATVDRIRSRLRF
jgi:histidine triad (HIT) family protein